MLCAQLVYADPRVAKKISCCRFNVKFEMLLNPSHWNIWLWKMFIWIRVFFLIPPFEMSSTIVQFQFYYCIFNWDVVIAFLCFHSGSVESWIVSHSLLVMFLHINNCRPLISGFSALLFAWKHHRLDVVTEVVPVFVTGTFLSPLWPSQTWYWPEFHCEQMCVCLCVLSPTY